MRAVEPVPLPPVQTVLPTKLAEAVVASMPDPVAAAPEPAFALVPDSVPVVEPAVEAPAPESWLAEPETPPTPVVIHPPVPADELPPLDEPAAKAPFWKKELSLSRKPKQAKAPKQEKKKKKEKKEKTPKPPREQGERTAPFWKRELSLSRKPKTEPVAVDAAVAEPEAKSAPFWKRQVSFSKPKLSLPGRSEGEATPAAGHKTKRVVGLKIGASQLAAARISNNGVAELQQVVRAPLASGVVVGGELRDPEALSEALKAFFARNKLPRKGVRLGIASNRIGVRIIEIPGAVEEKQLANAVQFRAQEALPIPLDEAVLDFRVLEETIDAEGQSVRRVLLVVAFRELIERYVAACRKAGISLDGIDLEAFALLRALGAPANREGSALVAVAIGHDRSTFAVSDGRICEFTRVIDWGGSALNVSLARMLDSTPSEVEAIKRGLSVDGSVVPDELTSEQAAIAVDAVRKQVQSFARELVSSLQFYQGQPGSLGIGEIVITGGTAQLPGLAEELERLIGVAVRIGDPFARLKLTKKAAQAEQVGSLAVAIGLGIED
jgi:type IV pilus assembly protein PilM